MNITAGDRRPIKSRNTYFANRTTGYLVKLGLKPNHISLLSIVFAGLAALCLILSNQPGWHHTILLLLAAFFILMRLLCNLFDGMVAIEGGFATKSGEIFNDLPDRPSDIIILIGAGFAAIAIPYADQLGWVAALFAVMTAYVRVLGKAAGTPQFFIGPMAKQHRMAVMIIACLAAAFTNQIISSWIFVTALLIIILGCCVTIYRRLKSIINALENN